MAALIEKEKEERQAAILAAKSKGKYDRLYLVIHIILVASSHEMGVSWTKEEVQLLIKAVTMYPAGTIKRYRNILYSLQIITIDGKSLHSLLTLIQMKHVKRRQQ